MSINGVAAGLRNSRWEGRRVADPVPGNEHTPSPRTSEEGSRDHRRVDQQLSDIDTKPRLPGAFFHGAVTADCRASSTFLPDRRAGPAYGTSLSCNIRYQRVA